MLSKQDRLVIRYHRYMCHPETCCHDDHKPWWVEYENDGVLLAKFDRVDQATQYCNKLKRPFYVKERTWDTY